MKPDISTRQDIELLVDTFYAKVVADSSIGFLFNEVAKVNWNTHKPIMYDFWESVLLGAGSYKGNPVITHLHLHQKEALQKHHFERWEMLFSQTIDALFEGEKAHHAKIRANSISTVLQIKIASLS